MNHCKVCDSYYILQFYVTTSHFISYRPTTATSAAEICSSYYSLLYTLFVCIFVCFWGDNPQWARASSFTKFLDHTKRRNTVGRTPLDE
jgi:hypothetical protein